MHGLSGERVLMRLYVGGMDRFEGRSLVAAIVDQLRARGYAGATVLPSIMAFGARRIIHSELNEITALDLPSVIECVETADRVGAALPVLDRMIDSGLITLERADVIVYRAHDAALDDAAAERRASASDRESLGTAHPVTPATPSPEEREVPMHGFKGERTLMRIHIGERDRHDGSPLYEAIVRLLRKRGYAGATVFRGIMGFGAHAQMHVSKVFRLSSDLPIVIECVETEERIREVLPELDAMIEGGLITLERARVILYRPGVPESERAADWSTDLTGSWQVREPGA